MTPEEQRALKWQADQLERESFERSLQAKLTAPSTRAVQTRKNWDPLLQTESFPERTSDEWDPEPLERRC